MISSHSLHLQLLHIGLVFLEGGERDHNEVEGKRGRGRQRLGIMWTVVNKLCKERLAASCLCAPKRKLGCGRAIHFGLSIAHYVLIRLAKEREQYKSTQDKSFTCTAHSDNKATLLSG